MNWLKEIAECRSVDEVLGVVNDYLLRQSEEFWSWIPKAERPKLVASEDDVHYWHQRLAEHLMRIAAPNIRIQDLCVFFVRASARAFELRSRKGEGSSNDNAFGGMMGNGQGNT